MNRTKLIQCIGAAAVLVVGTLATSAAFAHKGHGRYKHKHKKHRSYDDDDGNRSRYDDDDGHSRYDDDDGNRSRYDDDDGGGYGHRDDDDDGRYGHRLTNLQVTDVTFNDLGTELEATATVMGVAGQGVIGVQIEATSELQSSCSQPGTITRANERLDVQTEGVRSFERLAADGSVAIELRTADAGQAGRDLVSCEANNGVQIDAVRFLDARIDVQQGTETVTLLCTFTTSTTDGPVEAENFECTTL